MSGTEWLVLAAGAAAIAWVNWYFFFAERGAVVARAAGGTQEIRIEVKGGYDPGVVRLKRGVPARLLFDRRDTSGCSEEVVLPAFGIRRFLPSFQTTPVEVMPNEAGTFEITCGMSMLHGKLVVED